MANGVVDKVGEVVVMLGDTLSTQSTTGPLGNLNQHLSDQVVKVVAGGDGHRQGGGTPQASVARSTRC
ncbi:hypothetical protein G3436_21460 [Pseudomonas sp. MAFF212427]|uniref:Uncharacterized protein n=1 Tax=Pseudomonas brassicae TaxID=2708063 RepID=A0A6B3NVH2_9PSED|nr:hypothetical protein [Pseudomonas brassicae]NER65966.1 hypothetical protein [Pseudomonas brassicae]